MSRKLTKNETEPIGMGLAARGDYQLDQVRVQDFNQQHQKVKKVKKVTEIVPKTANQVSKRQAPHSYVGDDIPPKTTNPSHKVSPLRLDNTNQNNTTMDSHPQHNSDGAGSPYQLPTSSHRRFSSALGDVYHEVKSQEKRLPKQD